MIRNRFSILVLIFAATFVADQASAQRGGGGRGGPGGGPRGGGGGMGCSRMNGTGTAADRTQTANAAAAFFANNATNQQPQFRQQQAFPNNRGSAVNSTNALAAANQVRATAAQFVRRAMGFDSDGDGELNEEELALVGAAVVKELQSRRQQNQNRLASTTFPTASPASPNVEPPGPTMEEMTAAFIARALTYDRDQTGSLNTAETRVMATALIRTLG